MGPETLLRVTSPMIRSVSILQMPFPCDVYWFITFCNRPVCGFFLGPEGSNLLALNHYCVMGSACARAGGKGSVFDVSGGHEILSMN
jgi:hypothetical protein